MKRVAIGGLAAAAGLIGVAWLMNKPRPGIVVSTRIVAAQIEPDDGQQQERLNRLEASVSASPEGAGAIRGLALKYALVLNAGNSLVSRVENALRASNNVWVLSNTAYSLQSLYSQDLQLGSAKPQTKELAEFYFERARLLDPSMDRAKILPQIDLGQVRRQREADQRLWTTRFDQAERTIRRVPIEAFPQLPAGVAGVLRARRCEIPQATDHALDNVIRGEFIERGQAGWAALCSVNGSSSLLVFRDDRDQDPLTLVTTEDKNYLQGGVDTVDYSHGIVAADREYIVSHGRPGKARPRLDIDHAGINDMFLGKASTIWYFERGQWLQLPGAD